MLIQTTISVGGPKGGKVNETPVGRLMVNLFYVSHADHRIPSAPKWNALADLELQQPKLPVPVEREK